MKHLSRTILLFETYSAHGAEMESSRLFEMEILNTMGGILDFHRIPSAPQLLRDRLLVVAGPHRSPRMPARRRMRAHCCGTIHKLTGPVSQHPAANHGIIYPK